MRFQLAMCIGIALTFVVPLGIPVDDVLQAQNAARTLYNNADAQVQQVTDSAFAEAFPSMTLYRVYELVSWPMLTHSMAWDGTNGRDVTKSFNNLMTVTGAIVNSAAAAIKYAKAFGQAGNTEIQVTRKVVASTDSSWLGATVSDPAATQILGGWLVTLTTWTSENGVLADWTIEFQLNSLKTAKWRVVDRSVGPSQIELEAMALVSGTRLENTYDVAGHTLHAFQEFPGGDRVLILPEDTPTVPLSKIAEATNYDGSKWEALYPTANLPNITAETIQFGQAMADGGKSAYENETTRNAIPTSPCYNHSNPKNNWGFVSKDADCVLRIIIFGANTLPDVGYLVPYVDVTLISRPEASNNVTIRVSVIARETLLAEGFYTNPTKHTVAGLGRMIIGHEHFHVLQFGIQSWGWSTYVEGQARHIQSIHVPDFENDATSLWAKQVAQQMAEPQHDLCKFSYPMALYWGALHQRDSGIQTTKRFLEKLALGVGAMGCNEAIPQKVTEALQARQAEGAPVQDPDHTSFILAFALKMYRRDFSWGFANDANATAVNWGALLPEVPRPLQSSGSRVNGVGAYGSNYTKLPATGNFSLSQTVAQPSEWKMRLFFKNFDNTVTVEDFGAAETKTVNAANYAEVVVNAVRLAKTSGQFTLTVTPIP